MQKEVNPETVPGTFNLQALMLKLPEINLLFHLKIYKNQKRLNFTYKYVNKDFGFWRTLLFTNESKFNVLGYDSHGDEKIKK